MKTIEQIRDAFHLIHRVATGQSDRGYMSIPADPERDADLIVAAAIDELERVRAEAERWKSAANAVDVGTLRAERDALKAQVAEAAEHLDEFSQCPTLTDGIQAMRLRMLVLRAQVEAARKALSGHADCRCGNIDPNHVLEAMDEAAK